VSGEAIAQGAAARAFVETYRLDRFSDRFLRAALAQVMAAGEARSGVCGEVAGGEDVLPAPIAEILFLESRGQIDGAVATFEILPVDGLDAPDVFLEGFDEAIGKHSDVVDRAFAVADGNLTMVKVEVDDAQAQGLDQPQAGAIEQPHHELGLVGAG
jgi:hypothetical protein